MPSLSAFARCFQWIAIPALVFGGAEAACRSYFGGSSLEWYRDKVTTVAEEAPRYAFVGTSRTHSAVDEGTFARLLDQDGNEGRAINLGMGNATSAIHLMAWRDRVHADSDALRDTTLFFETPAELPSFYFVDEFSWEAAEREPMAWRWHLMLDTVSVRDPRFLLSQRLNAEGKIKLLFRAWTRESLLLQKREILGLRWRGIVRKQVEKLVGKDQTPKSQPKLDLQAGAGIRTDQDGVAEMGAFAKQMIADLESFDGALPAWEATPAGALLDFAWQHGARVVCYDVPTGSDRRQVYDTPQFNEARQRFRNFLKERGIPMLSPRFAYEPEDLPDGTHLAESRAPAYTEALYEAWAGLVAKGE